MKRSAPLARLTPMRRTASPRRRVVGPTRRVPVRPVNKARLARLRAEQFGPHADAVACLPCAVCRPDFYARHDDATLAALLQLAADSGFPKISDPHHATRTRGAGGKAKAVVPACRMHHDEADDAGRHTFAARHPGIDLPALAERLWSTSPLRGAYR